MFEPYCNVSSLLPNIRTSAEGVDTQHNGLNQCKPPEAMPKKMYSASGYAASFVGRENRILTTNIIYSEL